MLTIIIWFLIPAIDVERYIGFLYANMKILIYILKFKQSWHFGRTQHFTSIGSHNIDGDENSENKDHYSPTIIWLDQQTRHFMDGQD